MHSSSDTIRVLHVDDEPGVAELAAEFLERQDDRFSVETATDAGEGQNLLAAGDFDCIVSDYDMPGTNGIEFLTTIREERPELPFILFTGKGSEEIASDAISAGVTDYLRKATGTDQYELLANRITNAVRQVRAEQRLQAERRRFQALFENLSQATVEVEWNDGEPIVKRINSEFTEVFGYGADEIIGESLDEYVVPDDRQEEAEQINQRMRSHTEQYAQEVTRPTVDGTRQFILQTATYGGGSGTFGVYIDITERERREREVERQNTRLRALFENFPEPTVAYVYQGGEPYVEDVNRAFADRFGWGATAATGEELGELIVPSDHHEEAQRIDERVQSGDVVDETIRRQTADGLGDFRLRNIPVPDDDRIDGYFVYADITAYKQREVELERQNDLFRRAQEIASVGAWEYDAVNDDLTWSEEVYEIYDRPAESGITVGEAIDYYHPNDRPLIRGAVQAALDPGEPFDIEARVITSAGDERWVRSRGEPQTEDGSIVRLRGTIQDITERRRREQERQRERDRYQSLFENNPLIIWEEDFSEAVTYLDELTADVDDVETYLLEHPEEITQLMERVEIVDVNQNAVEFYGAESKTELLDRVEELFVEESTEALAAEWAAIADGATRFRTEVPARKLSGERYRELLDLFVPEESADDYSRVYVIGTDITEQKERERELERQNERLDAFASVVSHDLRNPLNVAEGRLALARDARDSDHLGTVADAHDRMESLIDDLLMLSRQGEPVGETEPVDLGTLSEGCWRIVSTTDASLRIEADRQIRADPSRLRQVFENLYRNAVEHGSTSPQSQAPEDAVEHGSTGSRMESDDAVEHGPTSPQSQAPEDAVEHAEPGVTITVGDLADGFYVEDDGPGIPEDERTDVFEMGYSTTGDGTGFGLSIVREVVEAHGWEISVTESGDGGARFEITGVTFTPE